MSYRRSGSSSKNPFKRRKIKPKETRSQTAARKAKIEAKRLTQEVQTRKWMAVFFQHLETRGIPQPDKEVLLVKGETNRWDLAWPTSPLILAIEVDGGIWLKESGGHSSGRGIKRGMIKNNRGLSAGVMTFRFEPNEMLLPETADQVAELYRVLSTGSLPAEDSFKNRRFKPANIKK